MTIGSASGLLCLAISLALGPLGATATARADDAAGGGFAWEKCTQEGPGQRFALSAVWDPLDGGCLVYAGERIANGGFTLASDLWLLDPERRRWSQVSASDAPAGRAYHACAWDSKRDQMWVFGGVGAGLASRGDLCRFDAKARRWSAAPSAGDAPKARLSPCLHYSKLRDCLILYGGCVGFQQIKAFQDVWTYAIATATWSQVSADGPGRWQCASAWDDRHGRLLIQGGYDTNARATATTWTWNAKAATWADGGERPDALLAQAAAWDEGGDRMLMFSGAREGQSASPILYDWSQDAWHALATTGPGARGYAAMACDPRAGTVVVFGGIANAFGSPMVDADAWIGRPAPR